MRSRHRAIARAALYTLVLCTPLSALAQDDAGVPDAAPFDPDAAPPDAAPDPDAGTPDVTTEPGYEETATGEEEVGGTGVRGRVVDSSTGEGIIEGAVVVVGRSERVYTDIDGNFTIDLPPGEYTLRSFYDLYQPARVENVVVRDGERVEVSIQLEPDTNSVQEVVVEARAERGTAATQLQVRRQATSVSDAISAQEIQRTPDNTASEAARRVVAATIVDQYLFVRGLGGRYTNVMLNNAFLPATDPDMPGVQLDLFPSNILSSISVLKTFSPDLPASFAGGLMMLSTRDFPTRFTLSANVSVAANSETTFQDGLSTQGGDLDFLGIDDGTRDLPDPVPDDRRLDTGSGFTSDQINQVGRLFPNSWAVTPSMQLPNMRLGVSMGDTVTLGDRFLGYLVAFGYQYNVQSLDENVARVTANSDGGVMQSDRFSRRSTTQSALLGGLGTATLELADDNELTLTTLFNQAGEDYAGYLTGRDDREDQTIGQRRLRFVERFVWFNQVAGQHRDLFGSGAQLDWRFNVSLADRNEPDTRDLQYQLTDRGPRWADRSPNEGQRLYSTMEQYELGGGTDLLIPVSTATVKIGGAFQTSDRDYALRRFDYDRRTGADPDQAYLPPQEIFAPDQIGDNVRLREVTRSEDSYDSSQRLYAAYAMTDIPVASFLRFIGGVRAEAFRQEVHSASPFAEVMTPVQGTERTDVDALPAASLVFDLGNDMFVRSAYGMTVARPAIRELAPFLFPDFIRRRNILGDPGLERTQIQNFDLRWEWYVGETEVIAASVFAKVFSDPIEMVIVDRNDTFSYQNVDSATNLGAELEARVGLDRITPALDGFSAGANLTLVHSQVTLTDDQAMIATNQKRPLAGQSPYVANVSLGFAPTESTFSLFLYYNVFGRRIQEVGRLGLPDIYQEPFHSLDFVFSWDMTEHFALKGSLRNLLFSRQSLEQGGIEVRGFDPGLTGSLQLAWTN